MIAKAVKLSEVKCCFVYEEVKCDVVATHEVRLESGKENDLRTSTLGKYCWRHTQIVTKNYNMMQDLERNQANATAED